MRKRLNLLAILLLILSTNVSYGEGNKTKLTKPNHNIDIKEQSSDRIKRSVINQNDGSQFLANRGKRQMFNKDFTKSDIDMEINRKFPIPESKLHKDQSFRGTRGRRSSEEHYFDSPFADVFNVNNDYDEVLPKLNGYPSLIDRREDTAPFWGNRGRRNSDEMPDDNEMDGPFWSSRGRRQEEDPFWGNRGRRENKLPFWGNQVKLEDEPFWGNRGRRQENEPFWGNRGKRQEEEPFWGNRGKKDDEPFWDNRGEKVNDNSEPFWGNRGRRKEDLKESIMGAINKVEYDIDYLSRLKKNNDMAQNGQFWMNRGRESQLKHLFGGSRIKNQLMARPFQNDYHYELTAKPSASSTVMDDRIYANEPRYIIVERSGRSSAEIDPFFISRGKKNNLFKTTRGRRGALEEIVKSVRNDPFYIARGKKDTNDNSVANLVGHDEFIKAKELICATLELMLMKGEGKKVKREINENDRDRRNILKKLAAQLQNDPYFVSRGKKSEVKENDIEEFVNQVAAMCH